LLEHNRGYIQWIESVMKQFPELLLENCASGGMRMDYALLGRMHIQATSDQTDYRKTAFIASAAASGCLPEQAAVWWCYPVEQDDFEAVAFNVVNSILLRVYQSGRVTNLSGENWNLVKEGISLYKQIRPDILRGLPIWPLGFPSWGNGWVSFGLETDEKLYFAVWRLSSEEDKVHVKLPMAYNKNIITQTDRF
jgi:alpha-galactosidase